MPKVTGRMARLSLADRVSAFEAAEKQARIDAARTATKVTRELSANRRDPHPHRSPQQMARALAWKYMPNDSMVRFDVKQADAKARYWIIQELGTNSRGTIKQANNPNPGGRSQAGANYVRTVKAQRGRRIGRGGLAWGTTGGKFVYPKMGGGTQQIYPVSMLSGVPTRRPRMYISREIQGRHMVKHGGEAGFRQYRTEVLAAARRYFGRKS